MAKIAATNLWGKYVYVCFERNDFGASAVRHRDLLWGAFGKARWANDFGLAVLRRIIRRHVPGSQVL